MLVFNMKIKEAAATRYSWVRPKAGVVVLAETFPKYHATALHEIFKRIQTTLTPIGLFDIEEEIDAGF